MKYLPSLLLPVLLVCCGGSRAAVDTPVVAVAANFSPALEEIVREFSAGTGRAIRISTGSTGALVRQIEQGAPFELFLAADEKHVAYLQAKGLTRDGGRVYAIGVLVLYLPHTSGLKIGENNADILKQFYARTDLRMALANPDLAPYGLAAKQVLQHFGTWHMLQSRIVMGENVGQAAQFALSGSVDAALLPFSLTNENALRQGGQFRSLARDWYAPLRQRMVLLKNAGRTATGLYEFISSDKAQQIIRKYGYDLP